MQSSFPRSEFEQSPTGDPAPSPVPEHDEKVVREEAMVGSNDPGIQMLPAKPVKPAGRTKREAGGGSNLVVARLIWLMSVLLILLVVKYIVPDIAEEYYYASTQGRLRAEYETSGEALAHQPLRQLTLASQMVARRAGPSVVHIQAVTSGRVNTDEASHLFGPHSRESEGQGSGVIVDTEGYILTNRHVIAGARSIQVTLGDDRQIPAEVIGVDAPTDLAVLKIDAGNLIAVEWGDSEEVQVGALVWAVGSPFGLHQSVTSGILSAKNRGQKAGNIYQDFLQSDAAVNPGNSGGPLVDDRGRVIGINTAILGETYQGISFAIPSAVARDVYNRIRTDGHVARGWLGIKMDEIDEDLAKQLSLPGVEGALIVEVVEFQGIVSPAKEAGLEVGDFVVQWNDIAVINPMVLSRAVAATEIGSAATIDIIRGGEKQRLQVVVGERPQQLY